MRALPRGQQAYARNRPKNKMAPLRVSGEAAAPQTPRPKGRPPTGYVWGGDGYVHHDTLLPFSREEHEALMKEVWREMRLQRYRVDARGYRTKRVQDQAKSRLAAGAKPRRRKLQNTLLPRSQPEDVNRCSDKS